MTPEEMTRLNESFERWDKEDRALAESLPNGITTGDLIKFLAFAQVICSGKVMEVRRIKCVAPDGTFWEPINFAAEIRKASS